MKKESQNYEYDAFISYKHADFDTEICRALHRQLESFKVSKSGKKHKINRVFLDTEELSSAGSLSESIQYALDNSRYLIVVCSKETPSSIWVGKEIEYFTAKHGYGNVLALLIDGEPNESFPEQLRQANIDGVLKEIEPLAADIRASNPKQSKKALRREILRLLAPLLGMSYDDLRQRHQKMVIRKVIRTATYVAALFLCFGVYASVQWYNIDEQNRIIQEQNELLEENNRTISTQNDELEESNRVISEKNTHVLTMQSQYMARESQSLLAGANRRLALYVARQSLPKSLSAPDRPYTEEAEFALTDALGVYYYPYGYFHSDAVFNHDSKVEVMRFSPQADLLAVVTATRLVVWQIEDGAKLFEFPVSSSLQPKKLNFSDDGRILYTDSLTDTLTAIDAFTGEILWESEFAEYALNKTATHAVGFVSLDWNTRAVYEIDLASGFPSENLNISVSGIIAGLESISENGDYIIIRGISNYRIIELASGRVAVECEVPTWGDVYIHEDIGVFKLDQSTSFFESDFRLLFFDLKTGEQINEIHRNKYIRKFSLSDDGMMTLVYYNDFEVINYITGESLGTFDLAGAEGMQACMFYNTLLFILQRSGQVDIYEAKTGVAYVNHSFMLPVGVTELSLENARIAGIRGGEVYIFHSFNTPNMIPLSDTSMSWAEFLDSGEIIGRGYRDGAYYFGLWNESEELIASLPSEWSKFGYDPEEKLLYYVYEDQLNIIRISNGDFIVDKTVAADALGEVRLTEDGTPILYYRNLARIYPGGYGGDEMLVETEAFTILNVYKRGEAFIFSSYYNMEIFIDGELQIKPSSRVYAVDPVRDEYVYYSESDSGKLLFQSFFDNQTRTVDIPMLGNISELFYAPDGSRLFIATGTGRLFAADMSGFDITAADITGFDLTSTSDSDLTIIEMEAEFIGTPQEAFYLGDVLVIKNSGGFATFWNPVTLKIIGQTSRLAGYSADRLVISTGFSTGIVPFYDTEALLSLADETLAKLQIGDRDKARYNFE